MRPPPVPPPVYLDIAPLYTCVYITSCYTTTMGVASINSIMCPQFGQFYKKVVLRLGEHGDVIETQTIRFVPPKVFLANSVPAVA